MKKKLDLLLLMSPLLLPGLHIQAQEKHNLVFIMADQWRGNAIGCLEKEPVKTPCLDKLASEGVNFTNAISSYPVSSPARAMLMTGMYPHKNKVIGNCNSENAPYGVELPQNARCWSDVLKDNDYQTGYIGKWHLDSPYKPYVNTYNNQGTIAWNEWCPKERRHGFDYWTAYGTYDYHLKPMYWDTDAPRDSFYYVNQWGPEYEADKAIEYLNNYINPRKPFALVVSMNPPHTGYELVPDKYKEIYKELDIETLCAKRPDIPAKGTKMGDYFRNNIRNYYACMTGVDENVGRIINELKRLNLFENTIVVFTSDHGICMGAHGQAGKDIFYEESMRIPMIISWPQKIKPKVDHITMMAFADLYPTLLSLMGLGKQIPKEVQTFDLSSVLLTGKENNEIVQPYYYIQPSSTSSGYRGIRSSTYTFVVHATEGKIDDIILFNRESDPYEMNNIASRQPILVSQFKKQLKIWLKKTDNPFFNYL